MGRIRMLSLALAALCCLPAFAQHVHSTGHAGADAGAGVGTLSFPTSTRVPAAQQAFERGMAWLHLFEYDKARTAFAEAQRLDPGFALAYWGDAMSYSNRIWQYDGAKDARAVLAKLAPTPQARAAKAPTAREKAFLDTAEQLFGDGTVEERQARFVASAARLASRFPDDEAQLLHALALFGADPNGRNEAHYAQAARLSGAVLARNRQHPGASHYLIHAVDDPAHAAEGLDAARALAELNPASPHAQHMTSHIFFALGRWDDAIAANVAAMQGEAELRKQRGVPPVRCGHAVDWLQYAYFQAGRVREARQTLADCIQDAGMATARGMMRPQVSAEGFAEGQFLLQDSLIEQYGTTLVESGREGMRDALMAVDTGGAGRFGGRATFARGYVAALTGDVDRAREFLSRLRAMAEQAPAEGEYDPHLSEHLGIQSDMLESLIDAHEGRMDVAIKRVRAAAAEHDAIPFQFGPPRTAKPPHELLGELLLRQGDATAALVAFDTALKTTPGRALSLLGRARALEKLGDAAAAAETYAKLAAQWHRADADLPLLSEVRKGAGDRVAAPDSAGR